MPRGKEKPRDHAEVALPEPIGCNGDRGGNWKREAHYDEDIDRGRRAADEGAALILLVLERPDQQGCILRMALEPKGEGVADERDHADNAVEELVMRHADKSRHRAADLSAGQQDG